MGAFLVLHIFGVCVLFTLSHRRKGGGFLRLNGESGGKRVTKRASALLDYPTRGLAPRPLRGGSPRTPHYTRPSLITCFSISGDLSPSWCRKEGWSRRKAAQRGQKLSRIGVSRLRARARIATAACGSLAMTERRASLYCRSISRFPTHPFMWSRSMPSTCSRAG